jgi:aspartate aminotransferase
MKRKGSRGSKNSQAEDGGKRQRVKGKSASVAVGKGDVNAEMEGAEEKKISEDHPSGYKFSQFLFQRALSFLGTVDQADKKQVITNFTAAYSIFPPSGAILKFIQNKSPNLQSYQFVDEDLRKCVIDHFASHGITVGATQSIVVRNSIWDILPDIYDALQLSRNRKKVLIFVPSFGYYKVPLDLKGIDTMFLSVDENTGKVNPEALRQILKGNEDIGAIIFTNPVNPTGVVYGEQDIDGLAKVLKDYPAVTILADQIFYDICFKEAHPPYSIGAHPLLKHNRVITLDGVSKTKGFGQQKLSFAIGPKDVIDKVANSLSGLTSDAVDVVKESLRTNHNNSAYMARCQNACVERVVFIKNQVETLNNQLSKYFSCQGSEYIKLYNDPQATTVILLDFSGLRGKKWKNNSILKDDVDVANFLLDKANVALAPGETYFIPGDKMLLSMSMVPKFTAEQNYEVVNPDKYKNPEDASIHISEKVIEESFERILEACKGLERQRNGPQTRSSSYGSREI